MRASASMTYNDAVSTQAHAIDALQSFLDWIETTPREQSPVEAPWLHTHALLQLEFGWAFERLGADAVAAVLLDQGRATLCEMGGIARFIADHYVHRRRAPCTGWTPETMAAFERFELFHRYKIGRTLQASAVLEPLRFAKTANELWGGEAMGMAAHSDVPWVDRMGGTLPARDPTCAATPWLHMRRWHHDLRVESPNVESALARIEREKARWHTVTDRWNTNSHWCLSVLAFVDGLLFDVVDRLVPVATTRVP